MRNQTFVHRAAGRIAIPAATLVLAFGLTGTADAHRRATSSEKRSIARSAGFPVGCLDVVVSVDAKGWASWNVRTTGSCVRRAQRHHQVIEASVFVRRSGSRWVRKGSTSDCGKPARVPTRAWRDLAPACDAFNEDGSPIDR